ncbi:hypothetical protein F3Y22_tig00110956pilonHSYRG00070 [Hibiscus syriacus]|uniref:non-specific serine/threonine protein kinase n=1 Tax=Hibiscus syriacus TaxID=106335 RepID=A0A6A2ZCE4_HIBSY|nr:hypothetical protein F3Y22_tig00110956pilonHSYRG00070 [Hibiscus syriacus]
MRMPQVVVEPTSARSNSFVGTHEYLAPEIIKGEGHGNAVDWWTFGIFLFEFLYGKTPFRGSGNNETLSNVVSHGLRFPTSPKVSFHARDLIRGFLVKEPENRLGSVKGASAASFLWRPKLGSDTMRGTTCDAKVMRDQHLCANRSFAEK